MVVKNKAKVKDSSSLLLFLFLFLNTFLLHDYDAVVLPLKTRFPTYKFFVLLEEQTRWLQKNFFEPGGTSPFWTMLAAAVQFQPVY